MFLRTGCDGVMIGRAAVGNPWIFSRINKAELSQNEILENGIFSLGSSCRILWKREGPYIIPKASESIFNSTTI